MNELKKSLKIYINKHLKENKRLEKKCFHSFIFAEESDFETTNTIVDFLNTHKEAKDFQSLLFQYIDKKNLKDADVYNKVHIDRRLFSKIRSDKDYHPSKETVILLGIALELKEEELDLLLESASYSLPKNNPYDLIIRFCFIHKIFKLQDINNLLEDYHCKLFHY